MESSSFPETNSCSATQESQHFMESEGSLTCAQEPVTGLNTYTKGAQTWMPLVENGARMKKEFCSQTNVFLCEQR
jgi:hypothetical protein